MTTLDGEVAPQATTTTPQAVPFGPGEQDMWYFVLFEASVFIIYFGAYMLYRMGDPALFLHSQATLDQNLGLLNTVILLTSSLAMASSVAAVRRGDLRAGRRWIDATIVCGAAFLVSKAFEWHAKISAGLTLSTNVFFSFYYFLTAIHVFHVLVGFIVLGVVRRGLYAPHASSLPRTQTGATFWHMVDFLWVFIFALLYLMR